MSEQSILKKMKNWKNLMAMLRMRVRLKPSTKQWILISSHLCKILLLRCSSLSRVYTSLAYICRQKDGSMYEMDGRKEFPVNHGPCTQDELLGKAAAKMKEYMQRDPEEMRFTMLALAPNQGE
eukprot:gb/GECG01010539.1/.p1 GENE.gb/GECG01010539.1/~~gb/GECG01010539.1/.p1  ORF type:complete len:123 (+),score=20.88 gb/GECG01010539.1/:1-369(+)